MPALSGICAALCALGLVSATPPVARPAQTTIRVNINFDRSVTSFVWTAVRQEVDAIWSDLGVKLMWTETTTGAPSIVAADAEAALQLRVIVVPKRRDGGRMPHQVLGRTMVDINGNVRGPIYLYLDPIELVLRQRETSNSLLHDVEFARAVGRVLAHELGHVLLGSPSYHDPSGLMRLQFSADQLAKSDRRAVQLADGSAERLRERLAALAAFASDERLTPPYVIAGPVKK